MYQQGSQRTLINPETGRHIKYNGPTHRRLIEQGKIKKQTGGSDPKQKKNFKGVKLREADLSGANFQGVDLSDANLHPG